MIRLLVLYGHPTDSAAFLDYYEHTHVPLASKLPGLVSYEWGRSLGTPTGDPGPYFVTADLTFKDTETLSSAFASPEGVAAAADIENFATGGASMMMLDSITAV